ncbi:Conserved_hypothetical protein [Hexamita inflata]|uniref:Uncharacterized protein n=1 Tax=Hexamita inflata TaxID=28002 RepID=A0AA86URT3_9EUKA|nr:Conserved hypothetical protein [Hexamita inflata]
MYSVKTLFDYQPSDKISQPPYSYSDISINDPNRLLIQHEIKQTSNNLCICDMALSETLLDFCRASKVINYIHHLYPFLSTSIVYDEKLQWMRYKQQDICKVSITDYAAEITSMDQLGAYLSTFYSKLSETKLCHWEIVKIDIEELKQIKVALSISIYHTLVDGGSVMMLYKKFNQLYSDLSVDLDSIPSPIQQTNFRSLMAYDSKLNLKQSDIASKYGRNLPLTKFSNRSRAKPFEQYDIICRYYSEDQLCRIPNVQYSISLFTIQLAQYVGYLYFNEDLKSSESFLTLTGDVRKNTEFHQNGVIPGLDLSVILGQTATTSAYVCKGTSNTTLRQIADQFQTQFLSFKQTVENFWQKVIDDNAPVAHLNKTGMQPCSTFTSNLGKPDLGEGPLVQFMGNQTFANIYESPAAFLSCFCRGKCGVIVTELDFKIFSKKELEGFNQVYIAINKKVKEVGAENITVQDVADIYTAIWK